jgi:hypothetical protein
MKHDYTDEELERALFALDLEEPPADLRASILAGTIYRVPVTATVRPWEIWLFGGLCAVLVWMLILVLRGAAGPAAVQAEAFGTQLAVFFSQPANLFWIAVGAAASVWISQLNLTGMPGYQGATRR